MCILLINRSNLQLLITSRVFEAAVDHYCDMIFNANDQNTDCYKIVTCHFVFHQLLVFSYLPCQICLTRCSKSTGIQLQSLLDVFKFRVACPNSCCMLTRIKKSFKLIAHVFDQGSCMDLISYSLFTYKGLRNFELKILRGHTFMTSPSPPHLKK